MSKPEERNPLEINKYTIELNENNENINKIKNENTSRDKIFSTEKISNDITKKKEKVKNNSNTFPVDEEYDSENYELNEEKKYKQSFISKRKREKSQKKQNLTNDLKINILSDKDNNNLETIINIKEFLSKMNSDNNISISNSDMILIILEICLNSSQFEINEDNSSRAFWEEIAKKEILFPITNIFKTETLRKYWRILRNVNKPKKIINIVKEYKDKLNNENIKLLSSINIVCDYALLPKKGIDYYIHKYCPKIINKNKKMIDIKDMSQDEQIEELIQGFEEAFPFKQKKEIMIKLYQNNFDIKNTYLVLKDEANFGYLSFDQNDDNLVLDKNIDNNKYREFALRKGHINIIRRKKFLEGELEDNI